MDYYPENIYPDVNQQEDQASWHKTEIVNLPLQPNSYWDNRKSAPNFAAAGIAGEPAEAGGTALFLQNRMFYGQSLDDKIMFFAPAEPVRYDYFAQLTQAARVKGKQTSGTAPYRGVYTGYQDLGTYSGPALQEIGGEFDRMHPYG